MAFDFQVVLVCLLIIAGRIGDVSLGTLRIVAIVQGYRALAWALGFAEVLIWIFVVGKVIHNLDQPLYAACYALGFATGNYIGLTIEQWVSIGRQVVRVFTRRGPELARSLREEGVPVTVFTGEGRDQAVHMLFTAAARRDIPHILRRVRQLDPSCFYVVDDIRMASSAAAADREPTGWRSVLKKK